MHVYIYIYIYIYVHIYIQICMHIHMHLAQDWETGREGWKRDARTRVWCRKCCNMCCNVFCHLLSALVWGARHGTKAICLSPCLSFMCCSACCSVLQCVAVGCSGCRQSSVPYNAVFAAACVAGCVAGYVAVCGSVCAASFISTYTKRHLSNSSPQFLADWRPDFLTPRLTAQYKFAAGSTLQFSSSLYVRPHTPKLYNPLHSTAHFTLNSTLHISAKSSDVEFALAVTTLSHHTLHMPSPACVVCCDSTYTSLWRIQVSFVGLFCNRDIQF